MEIWAISDGRAGFAAQARGLSQAVAALSGAISVEQTIDCRWPLHLLPAFAFARGWHRYPIATAAVPTIAIACGSRSAAAAIILRRHGAFSVFIQNPPFSSRHFDLVVAPAHDQVKGANVIETIGAVSEVTAQSLVRRQQAAQRRFSHIPAPRIGVLIGGSNRAFSLTSEDCLQLAQELKSTAHESGGGILATISRRTGKAQAETLARQLNGEAAFCWYGGDENPYPDILAAADFLLVSGDSVNMLSEACAAAKPVFIWTPPPRRSLSARHHRKKFLSFHQSLVALGLARPWRGVLEHWEVPGLQETASAARAVWTRFQAQQERPPLSDHERDRR